MTNKKIMGFDEFSTINENLDREGLAIVTGNGDWSKILLDPSPENISLYARFILPNKFIVTYNSNPDQSEFPSYADKPADNSDDIMWDIMSGDQNGVNVVPSNPVKSQHRNKREQIDEKNGTVRILTSLPSAEIRKALEDQIENLNKNIVEFTLDSAEDDLANSYKEFTPEYIEFLEGVRDQNRNVNGYKIELDYSEI